MMPGAAGPAAGRLGPAAWLGLWDLLLGLLPGQDAGTVGAGRGTQLEFRIEFLLAGPGHKREERRA